VRNTLEAVLRYNQPTGLTSRKGIKVVGTIAWGTEPHLWRLLNLNYRELQDYYPGYSKGTMSSKRSFWKKKILNGEIEMPKPPSRESSPEQQTGKLKSTWEVARGTGDDQWDVITLHSYDHSGDGVEYEPVEPAKIRPTRARRAVRASRFILVHGDGQVDYRRIIDPVTDEMKLVPLHNVPMHQIIKQFNARFRPETTVNLGDFADMAALSRFASDSDHFHKTLGPSMRYIHDFYAQLVADNPDAHHVEVDSNHAVRPKRQILANVPAFHDFVRPGEDYPMMTYYYLANLGKLGIDFVSGYGAAQFVYGEDQGPPIVFKHGNHSSSNPGATVRKEAAENPEVNVVRGHGHSDEHVSITTRSGRRLFYHQIGSSCMNNGPVPGYHSAVDDHNRPVEYHNCRHQNTFAMIEDYGDGEYQVDIINVRDGRAYFRGEQFDGSQD